MLKRISKLFFKAIGYPLKKIAVLVAKWIGVPGYRVVFFVRRTLSAIFLPAKHRFFYILSNKYTIHFFIIVLVLIVGVGNFQTRNVRAETFGQKSVLYSLVSVDDSQTIEVVEAGKTVLTPEKNSSYFTDISFDTRSQDYQDDFEYVNTEDATETPSPSSVPQRSHIETYVVKDGDTLGKISVKFHLSISTLLFANHLTLKSTIQPGDSLKILPEDGILYTIKQGDTVSKIAKIYNVDEQKISQSNALSINTKLKIGDDIFLPGAIISSSSAIARKNVGVKDLFVEEKKQNSSSPRPTTPVATGWVWPTTHHVITQYFSWKHTGLDIDGDYSTFSIAAHDGVVSYTGWRNGYGLTVEIDHGNGLKTRYAHNSKIFVNTGDLVGAGERLAQTGTTGRSTGTHLHFEVISNGKFQNPLSYVR